MMEILSYILIYLLGVLLGCIICLLIKINKTKKIYSGNNTIKIDTENELFEITIPKEVIEKRYERVTFKIEYKNKK